MYQPIIDKHNLISLNEESHTYTLKNSDTTFSSVTQFISHFFQPFNEHKIAKKLTTHRKYQGKSVEDILLDWKERRDRGTIVHKQIEDFITVMNEEKDITTIHQTLDLKSRQAIHFLKEFYFEKTEKKKDYLIFQK